MGSTDIFKLIFFLVTPFILSTFIYNFSTSLDQSIYTRVMMGLKNYTSEETAEMYGVFAGKAVVIVNIPIAISSAVSAAMIPTISGCFAKGNVEETRQKVSQAIRTTMLIAIPAAVGLAVLAEPITRLLFPQRESLALASALLRAMSVSVVFYSLSTLTNAVLQSIGMVNKPVKNAAIALLIQSLVLVPLLLFTKCNQYAMVIAAIVYSLSMCVLNHRGVSKDLGYRQEYLKTFIMPGLSAMVMGMAAWGIYELCDSFLHINVLSLLISILVAAVIYFILIIRTGAMGTRELQAIPGGKKIWKIARMLRLL